MVVGLATVGDAAEPVPDHEHDEWAWWPADVDEWPAEADDRLKLMARLLGAGEADRAAHARAAEPAVAVRVLREVLLVVVLGVVERPARRRISVVISP